MQNHYFDTENPLHPYTHSSFANEGTLPPVDALRKQPFIKVGSWPCESNGTWVDIEDHRTRSAEQFGENLAQEATAWWLPDDAYGTPARKMETIGPLPNGALLKTPEQPLAEAQEAKRASINAGHDAALAGAVALSDPSPSIVAVEAVLLAASDLEGLEYVRDTLEARRDALLAAVNAATTVEAVQAITISYAV